MSDNFDLRLNGHKVGFTLSIVTEPGEGWKGEQFIGHYDSLKLLNRALNELNVPEYWQIKIDLNGDDE